MPGVRVVGLEVRSLTVWCLGVGSTLHADRRPPMSAVSGDVSRRRRKAPDGGSHRSGGSPVAGSFRASGREAAPSRNHDLPGKELSFRTQCLPRGTLGTKGGIPGVPSERLATLPGGQGLLACRLGMTERLRTTALFRVSDSHDKAGELMAETQLVARRSVELAFVDPGLYGRRAGDGVRRAGCRAGGR
jgi:hypothetical protein